MKTNVKRMVRRRRRTKYALSIVNQDDDVVRDAEEEDQEENIKRKKTNNDPIEIQTRSLGIQHGTSYSDQIMVPYSYKGINDQQVCQSYALIPRNFKERSVNTEDPLDRNKLNREQGSILKLMEYARDLTLNPSKQQNPFMTYVHPMKKESQKVMKDIEELLNTNTMATIQHFIARIGSKLELSQDMVEFIFDSFDNICRKINLEPHDYLKMHWIDGTIQYTINNQYGRWPSNFLSRVVRTLTMFPNIPFIELKLILVRWKALVTEKVPSLGSDLRVPYIS